MPSMPFVDALLRATTVQRWTDRVRPIELTAAGKHGHAIFAAWALARSCEQAGGEIDWLHLVSGAVGNVLWNSVMTDIRTDVLREIASHREQREVLDSYVESQLAEVLDACPGIFTKHVCRFFARVDESPSEVMSRRILSAGGAIATVWEYRLLESVNSFTHDFDKTGSALEETLARYAGFEGMPTFVDPETGVGAFSDIAGRLRITCRWSQTPIVPMRPVMDHSLLVASLAFMTVMRKRPASPDEAVAAFFAGLFHDFAEALTRDIVAPVKRGAELEALLASLEQQKIADIVAPLLPPQLFEELRFLVSDEFSDKRWPQNLELPAPSFLRRDVVVPGQVVRECDKFVAFLEASQSITFGVSSDALRGALSWDTRPEVADFSGLRNAYLPR